MDRLASYHCSAVKFHGAEQRPAWRHTSATQSIYRRQRSCDRTGSANLGELYHPDRSGCGSILLRTAGRIIDWRLFVALGTEADRAPGNAFPPGFTDLQSWTRDLSIEPDWLRVGTDITGQGPFNAAFVLNGVAVPGPIVGAGLPGLILACGAILALARRRRQFVA